MVVATANANKPEAGNTREEPVTGDAEATPVSAEQQAEAKKRIEDYLTKSTAQTGLSLSDRVLIAHRRQAGSDGKVLEDVLLHALVIEPANAEDALLAERRSLSVQPKSRKEQQAEGSRQLLHQALEHLESKKLAEWDRDDSKIWLPEPDLNGLPFDIDAKLKNLLPPLAEEELSALEHSLLTVGPEDPVYIWKEKRLLIDGHNRICILLRHGRREELAKLKVIEESLGDDREAAHDWIEERQGGRRNQSRLARMYSIGRRYNREKKQGERTDMTSDQNERKSGTDERLAEKYGIAPATIRRAGVFASSLDTLIDTANGIQAGKGEQLRGWLLRRRPRGEPRVTEHLVNSFAELPEHKRKTIVRGLLEGRLPKRKSRIGKRTENAVIELKADNPQAQAAALETTLGREGLEKLLKAIDKLLVEAGKPKRQGDRKTGAT